MAFVLDVHQNPLMPCTENRARQMLEPGRAQVHQMAPFTIRLKGRTAQTSVFQSIQVKFDPGSNTTGVVIIREGAKGPSRMLL